MEEVRLRHTVMLLGRVTAIDSHMMMMMMMMMMMIMMMKWRAICCAAKPDVQHGSFSAAI